jgi:hypothetical protein
MARQLREINRKRREEERMNVMKLSLVPLLLDGESLSPETKAALREDRRRDAAVLLMEQYDLDCREAGELVDAAVCGEEADGALRV